MIGCKLDGKSIWKKGGEKRDIGNEEKEVIFLVILMGNILAAI